MNEIDSFFNDFLKRTGKNARAVGTICFGMNEAEAGRAIEQILSGRRTMMIYPKHGYRGAMHADPAAGDLNIVTDWSGKPACVIETVGVIELCAGDVSDAQCAAAGEYENADAWRAGTVKTEVEELGDIFGDATPIVIEEFAAV